VSVRDVVTTVLEVAGFAAITAGFAAVSWILGLIVGGTALLVIGYRAS